jgi:hypothetical protein
LKNEDFIRDLRSELERFLELYMDRPIKNNIGGMGLNHSFAFWRMLRILKPDLVVESGVWKGHSTWLIENALPESRIISFDIKLSKREYVSQKAIYVENDFQYFDWASEDVTNSLILFDDHQNSFNRVVMASFFGFKNMIFEDNYTSDNGDFYTLNHIFSNSGFTDIQLSKKHRRRPRTILRRLYFLPVLTRIGSHQHWLIPANPFDSKFLRSKLSTYELFPRIFDEDGKVADGVQKYIPNFQLPSKMFESNFSYNNISFLSLI